MANEQYLVASYFVCAALSLGLGALVYLLLRRPFGEIANAASAKRLTLTLKRLFPLGLVFPSLLGFASVSYHSCSRDSYELIVESRQYLVAKNQEQISSALLAILIAVLFWNFVLILVLKSMQHSRKRTVIPPSAQ